MKNELIMSVALTTRATDRSSGKSFAFSFYCDNCGSEWASQVIPFQSGGFTAIENEEAKQLIWAHEHRTAFERANLEAHFHFNHCPDSGKWICDECYSARARNY